MPPSTQRERTFQRSAELKRIFNHQLEAWSRKSRLGIDDLAERCGVSVQYLHHIGRYGRVPGKPILIVLAMNLAPSDPGLFFRAAGIPDPWPYEPGTALRPPSASESGFLSLNLDMAGFTDAIRQIVRSEVRPKSLQELLAGRPLRIGLNRAQSFLFDAQSGKDAEKSSSEGFFPELMRLLSLAVHAEVEFRNVPHFAFAEQLQSGAIDLYGPIYSTPTRIAQALYTAPFCRVRPAGLYRVRVATALEELPVPESMAELGKRHYRIAVHRDSMSHHFVLNDLGVPEDRVIACETPEESLERIILTGIPRPAHLLLTDAPHAAKLHRDHLDDTRLALEGPQLDAAPYEDTVAIRSDWPSVVTLLDETLSFMRRNGSVQRLFQRTVDSAVYPGISME